MNEQLFRKKSIERVSSPEQLNEYIRVSNPGVWMVLSAIVILLVGICVWGILGRLDTTLSTIAVSKNGETVLYVKEADIAAVKTGMTVTVDGMELTVEDISTQPVPVDESFSEYALHAGALQVGEWVYILKINGTLDDGVHTAQIVIDSVSPMSFVLN